MTPPTTLAGIMADPLRGTPFPYHVPPSGDDLSRFLLRTEGQPGHTWSRAGRQVHYYTECIRCDDEAAGDLDALMRGGLTQE